MNDIRDKIWFFLNDSKTNEYFAARIVRRYQKFDLYANVMLVIATSSSVAAWAIWKIHPTLWAMIIGISQVVTLLKPYFLFPKYIKVFNEKSIRWQNLSMELEKLWFNLNNDIVDEKQAAALYFDLKQKSILFDNVPEDIIFFDYSRILKIAEKQCDIYISKI